MLEACLGNNYFTSSYHHLQVSNILAYKWATYLQNNHTHTCIPTCAHTHSPIHITWHCALASSQLHVCTNACVPAHAHRLLHTMHLQYMLQARVSPQIEHMSQVAFSVGFQVFEAGDSLIVSWRSLLQAHSRTCTICWKDCLSPGDTYVLTKFTNQSSFMHWCIQSSQVDLCQDMCVAHTCFGKCVLATVKRTIPRMLNLKFHYH